jgi:hypothetical protein
MGTVPRVIAFILVGVVLLTAVGLFLTGRVSTAPTPDSALAAATSGAASTPASAATLPPSIVTSPVSLASAPVGVPAAAPSAAAAPASGTAEQKACVRRADGAVICGAVASLGNPAPNPFDGPVVTQPFAPPPSVAARKPVRMIHQTERRPPPPSKHASRQPTAPPPQIDRRAPLREADKRPPLRHVASIDTRHLDRRPPPPRVDRDRGPPPRFSEPDRQRFEGDRQRVALRAPPPPGYEARLRKLEREIHALRDEALRKEALRRAERRDVVKRSYPQPPPGYRERDTRYDGGPMGEPANPRRVDRGRQSIAD